MTITFKTVVDSMNIRAAYLSEVPNRRILMREEVGGYWIQESDGQVWTDIAKENSFDYAVKYINTDGTPHYL